MPDMPQINTMTEQEIVCNILDGDISAKRHLYCQFAPYLTGVCSRYIAGTEDVRDVIHDSFLKIFSTIRSFEFRGPGSLKAWMTKIVVNESLKFIKSTCRFALVELTDNDEDIPDETPDIDGIPLSELHRMIRELPVGYRTILNLFVFEELSHKEIAKTLNITESTSASQFHRAKKMLSEKIKQYNLTNLSIAYER